MSLSSDLFHETVQYLEQHEDSLRIKKLIFCLCKKYWENDPNILNSFTLEDLMRELIQSRPTVDQLTFALYKLVKTLNRPKVYAEVAKVILERMVKLYNKPQDTQVTFAAPPAAKNVTAIEKETQILESDFSFEQVVANLSNHQEKSRIKKLLFSVCKNRWENDSQAIDAQSFQDLVAEIVQIYPTKAALKTGFQKVVENLNKQSLYLAIANMILNQMEILYNTLPEELENDQEGSTQLFKTQITQPNSPLETSPTSPRDRSNEFATAIIDLSSDPTVTELRSIQQVPSTPAIQPLSSVSSLVPARIYDLFEVRLEIMQYTNPLRAKILLFSILFHPWDRSGQDWSMLRSYSLDDLLEQLIMSRKSLSEIESKLYNMARSLNDPEEQLQTASTIIEAIKSFIP